MNLNMIKEYTTEYKLPTISGLYFIQCDNVEYAYIGHTKNLRRRIQQHLSMLRNNKHYNKDFQKDFNEQKIRIENLYMKTIKIITIFENEDIIFLKKLEAIFLDKFNTHKIELKLYNIMFYYDTTFGGD